MLIQNTHTARNIRKLDAGLNQNIPFSWRKKFWKLLFFPKEKQKKPQLIAALTTNIWLFFFNNSVNVS